MHPIRQFGELCLTRFGMALVPRFSRRTVLRMANGMGWIAYYVSIHLRHVGYANLDIVYGDTKDRAWKKSILMQSFQTFALTILDLFWFSARPDRMREYVHFDPSYDMLKQNIPTMLLTGHIGNWEIGGRAVQQIDVELVSVAAPLANRGVDELFNNMRMDAGQKVVSKKGAVRQMIKTLKNNGNIALLLDQNTKPGKGGVLVDFFGKPVPISNAAAALWMHTGAQLVFGSCMPDERGHYHCKALKTVDLSAFKGSSRKETFRGVTQAVADTIAEHIRTYPDSWVWTYKRWKYVAPGHARDEFPFYAKLMQPVDQQAVARFESP